MASTAWVNKTNNEMGRIQQTFDLALAGAAQGYTTVINGIKIRREKDRPLYQYVTFCFDATAVTGTNLDIAIYGSDQASGTAGTAGAKYLLLDAVVADITATGKVAGTIDMQAYPAAYYWISVTGDNAETGNTLAISIHGDLNGSQS